MDECTLSESSNHSPGLFPPPTHNYTTEAPSPTTQPHPHTSKCLLPDLISDLLKGLPAHLILTTTSHPHHSHVHKQNHIWTSLTHTLTHSLTHSTPQLMQTHSTLANRRTLRDTLTQTHTDALMRTHIHTHICSHIHTHTYSHIHNHICSCRHTHTHSHIHTHTLT